MLFIRDGMYLSYRDQCEPRLAFANTVTGTLHNLQNQLDEDKVYISLFLKNFNIFLLLKYL